MLSNIVELCLFGLFLLSLKMADADADADADALKGDFNVAINKVAATNELSDHKIHNYIETIILRPMLNAVASVLNVNVSESNETGNYSFVDMILYGTMQQQRKDAETQVVSLWPHFQMNYCFIYSNSKKVPAHEMITYTLGTAGYIMTIVPLYVSWAYHYLILRFRVNKTNFEAITRGLVYSIQKHVNSSIPTLDKYRHERIFLATMYFYIFVTVFMYLSYFATQCTIPTYRPQSDLAMPPMNSAGVGIYCMQELMRGKYLQRLCLVSCQMAKSFNHKQAFAVSNTVIHFENAFLMNRKSLHFKKVRNALKTFAENGMIELTFQQIQAKSHRFVTQSLSDQVVNLNELQGLIVNTLGAGSIVATFVFIIEHIYYIRHRPPQHKRQFGHVDENDEETFFY